VPWPPHLPASLQDARPSKVCALNTPAACLLLLLCRTSPLAWGLGQLMQCCWLEIS
jgi:hypothetical protein